MCASVYIYYRIKPIRLNALLMKDLFIFKITFLVNLENIILSH